MKAGIAPVHLMKWAVQDWNSSPLRAALIAERNHVARLVYLELLFKLHEEGGAIRREEVAGAVGVTQEEADAALARLIQSKRVREKRGGWLTNPRVSKSHKVKRSTGKAQSDRALKRVQTGKRNDDGTFASSQHPAGIQPSVAVAVAQPTNLANQPAPTPLPGPGESDGAGAAPPSHPAGNGALAKDSYFADVWSVFCDVTGQKRLVPSSQEAVLIARWHEARIPLRSIVTTLKETDSKRAAAARSLAYFDAAVLEHEARRRKLVG